MYPKCSIKFNRSNPSLPWIFLLKGHLNGVKTFYVHEKANHLNVTRVIKDLFQKVSNFDLLTLKRARGVLISPLRLWRPAVWFWMRLGMSNLHVNFIFGVCKQQRKWLWGLYKKDFEKFTFEKFFFHQNRNDNFWKSIFFQKNF